ncbi:hypothetical protein [Fluviicola sp.]|jgi:hypothetical protein|uniref:hypothetical protein n=1 Tax=Fluviicola sp. TaxID=1917219 RepID=UPI0028240DA1|nr:hypothetical protein [Fluviicola sp.]MDR0801615.1 hypothetical protein [Fluviicola sp.]
MKRDHGKHNKAVCDFLHLNSGDKVKCNDWIITTAFYSSIHFIDHILFPLEHNGKKFSNISEAHNNISSQSVHQTRGILVNLYLTKINTAYKFLISESQSARYSRYDINEATSNLAVKHLEAICKECDKNK